MAWFNGKTFTLLVLLTVPAAFESTGEAPISCTTYQTRKHTTDVAACLCTGDLSADAVNVYIGKQKCATITLANCTIDQMVSQMDEAQAMYEAHYILYNCHIRQWQSDYMIEAADYEESIEKTPSQIQFLEFRNVTLGEYDGWHTWTRAFDAGGKLRDMLRFDNSVELVMNAGPLFSETRNTNYELAITFANMNLSDSSLQNQVMIMLFVFNKAPKELGEEEKSAFLNTLIFESTQLVSIPKLLISVQPLDASTSTLSFRGNRIREVDSTAFETYKVAGLLSLDLSNNEIEVLHQSALSNFTSLRELDLSYNRLEKLDFSTFSQLKKLAYLNLRNNRLTVVYLPPGIVMSLPTSQTPGGVLLGNNPWNCTCTLYPLINIFRDMSSKQNASVAAAYQEVPMCSSGINFNQVQGSSSCPVSLLAPPTTTGVPTTTSTTTRTSTTTSIPRTSTTTTTTTTTKTSTTTTTTKTSTTISTTTSSTSTSTVKSTKAAETIRARSPTAAVVAVTTAAKLPATDARTTAVPISDTEAVAITTTVGIVTATAYAIILPIAEDGSPQPSKVEEANMTVVWIVVGAIILVAVIVAVVVFVIVRKQKRKGNGSGRHKNGDPLMMNPLKSPVKDKHSSKTNGHDLREESPLV